MANLGAAPLSFVASPFASRVDYLHYLTLDPTSAAAALAAASDPRGAPKNNTK